MVKAFFSLFFCFFILTAAAQQIVKQPNLRAEYEVPSDWKVQEYYKGDWDKSGGSGICHCALSVNILKVPFNGDFDYLHMVVYPSDKKGAADPQRGTVWQYKIAHGDNGDSLKTPYLNWKMYTGKLTTQGENRFKDCIAYKYQTHQDKVYYTVYFWGKPGLMSQYKAVIDKIMSGFKPL
jgi:hypothetical protein